MSRMKQKYNDITPALREECGIKNVMQTPKLEKIVISVGRGTLRKGFDGRGNYNFGLQEQLMFPEKGTDVEKPLFKFILILSDYILGARR